MFILEKPYVSELLVDTIVQNDWPVLDNTVIQEAAIEEGAFTLWSDEDAKQFYAKQEFPLIYSNSDNAISWIMTNLPQSNLASYIKIFKDKILFREMLKELYPGFYFEAKEYDELKNIKPNEIKYPVVLKPSVGFLSLGVHTIRNADEWKGALDTLKKEVPNAKSVYSENVLNSSKFLIEELIEGEEYAIDAYYDRNGEVSVLNIFRHPFFNEKDVSDRIYVTSAEIIIRYMAKFHQLIKRIGDLKNIRNLPIHMEVRVTQDGTIIPIEVNPLRFAGWCTADIAKYAWGINAYEYYYHQRKPDWNDILERAGKKISYFSIVEVPPDVNKDTIKGFDYERFLANYSNILELRRVNPRENLVFAVVLGSTENEAEIRRILSLKVKDYIRF